jgi:hypothetical protein
MLKQIAILNVMALCMSIQLNAMDQTIPLLNYLENGNPCGDEEMPLFQNRNGLIYDIEHFQSMGEDVTDLSTPEHIEQPNTVRENRLQRYTHVWDEFIQSIKLQQQILKNMRCTQDKYMFSELTKALKTTEQRTIALSCWLTAIRSSGEEHSWTQLYNKQETSIAFWQSTLRPMFSEITPVFKTGVRVMDGFGNYLNADCVTVFAEDPCRIYINPTSMAMIRHQLDKGFEGLDYKKTTEYTGPALCRVKIKGEEDRSDWDFQTFMKTLELAEEQKEEENRFSKKLFFPANDNSFD